MVFALRIRTRGVEDPKAHNFPYSYDDDILGQPGVNSRGGTLHTRRGFLNGHEGRYEIVVSPNGVIYHRQFRRD